MLPTVARADEAADAKVREAFMQQYDQSLQQDPKAAIALFQQFLKDHAQLDPWQMMVTYENAAFHLYQRDPAQLDTALQILQAADKRFAKHPDRLWPLTTQASLLRQSKRAPEAEALLAAAWPQAMQGNTLWHRRFQMLSEYVAVLRAQDKNAEAETLLLETLETYPTLLQESEAHIATMMVELLRAQKKTEAALSWAKLNFMLVPFDEKSISEATQQLTRLWIGDELEMSVPRAFAAAQSAAGAPNPLDKVALPQWSEAMTKSLQDKTGTNRASDRIMALLALGQFRTAMLQAREMLVRDPASNEAVQQVARVFKAADGDVVRANAFIAYYSSGQGENPMKAFLDETAAADKTPGQ